MPDLVKNARERDVNDDSGGLAELLHAVQAMRVGDFSVRMAGDRIGVMGKIADTFNEIVATNQRMAKQVERVGQVVGREGKTRQRIRLGLSDGAWGEMEASVNSLIDDLVWPTTEMTRAIAAVAQGDLLRRVSLDVDGRPLKGEFLRSAEIVNTMIKQLNVFTSEVTRVAREVGTEGKLGGQAQVGDVTGVWKDLIESVNSMVSNLTAQVRNIAEATIAVANGDLSKKITVDVRGEILQLKEAINTMVDQLRSFASEVIPVAREVGTEGTLGGQQCGPESDRLARVTELLGGQQTLRAFPRNPLEAHEMLVRGIPGKALAHLVENFIVLNWDAALANAIGMSLRTYQRHISTRTKFLSQEQSGRTWKLAEILAKATEVFGSQQEAEQWLERPAIGLNQRRPIDLLATPAGVELVETFLDRLDYGVYT